MTPCAKTPSQRQRLNGIERQIRRTLIERAGAANLEYFLWDQMDKHNVTDHDEIVLLMGKFGVKINKS